MERIVPPSPVPTPAQQLPLELANAGKDDPAAAPKPPSRPRHLGWAHLLARVFAVDVTVCRRCGGRMRVIDVVSDPDDIARILHGARAPPRPPRPHPPGLDLDLSDAPDPSALCLNLPEGGPQSFNFCGTCFNGVVGTGRVKRQYYRTCNNCTKVCGPWTWVENCVEC